MEHNEHPQQELPESPAMEPAQPEELPQIQELTFEDIPPMFQELILEPDPVPQEPPMEELPIPEPAAEEKAAEEETVEEASEEPAPMPEAEIPEELPSFMERIPDTDLDYPELAEAEFVQEGQSEESALDAEHLLDYSEEELLFDRELLNDPELRILEEAAAPEEIPDQEYRVTGEEFEDLLKAPAAEPQSAPLPRQQSKGRPKRKKGEGLFGIPNILVTFVWLALIVMIGVTGGRMLWVCAADVLAFGREDRAVTLTVYEADSMDDIIDKLYDNGLIRYKSLFKLYADISDAREDIKPGIYDLNTRYDYHALVNFMSPRSSREVITLTIPEGYTCRQIFALLEENRICTAVDAAAYAASGELDDYWFLEGVERGESNCLEGYLFPDTYEFYKNSSPREALSRMLNNFEVKFTDEMKAQLDKLNANLTGDYTVREIVIVASLIEKESASAQESPSIAGVIYNRLFDWGNTPAYLNIDASIVYALEGKSALTREDLQMDHPYNTYTNIGLTPGPISNPGLASLKAALNPASHNYYYYVLNPATGMHQFSTTYEEHTGYVNQFAEE